MKLLRLTLDEQTVRMARKRAAERGMSLTSHIADVLRQELHRSPSPTQGMNVRPFVGIKRGLRQAIRHRQGKRVAGLKLHRAG